MVVVAWCEPCGLPVMPKVEDELENGMWIGGETFVDEDGVDDKLMLCVVLGCC